MVQIASSFDHLRMRRLKLNDPHPELAEGRGASPHCELVEGRGIVVPFGRNVLLVNYGLR